MLKCPRLPRAASEVENIPLASATKHGSDIRSLSMVKALICDLRILDEAHKVAACSVLYPLVLII